MLIRAFEILRQSLATNASTLYPVSAFLALGLKCVPPHTSPYPSLFFISLLAHEHHILHLLYCFLFPLLSYVMCLSHRHPPSTLCPSWGEFMKVGVVWSLLTITVFTADAASEEMDHQTRGGGRTRTSQSSRCRVFKSLPEFPAKACSTVTGRSLWVLKRNSLHPKCGVPLLSVTFAHPYGGWLLAQVAKT